MANKWIEHVKAYAKQHGVSYKKAMKDAKSTYTKVAKTKGEGHRRHHRHHHE